MPSIFLSYSRKDEPFASRLRLEFEERGWAVWFDQLELRVGDKVAAELRAAIRGNDFFVLVWSPDARDSAWVNLEIEEARQREEETNSIRILVANHRECTIPAELSFLKDRLYADFRSEEEFDQGLGELIVGIQRYDIRRSKTPSFSIQYQYAPANAAFVEADAKHGRQVIHILDAPVNYGGQKAMVEVLRYVMKQWSVPLVLVEGGSGDVSLSYLREYGSPKKRLEVGEKYLREGIISGEEYLDVVSDEPLALVGVDDQEEYRQTVDEFGKASRRQDRLADTVSRVSHGLAQLKKAVLTPDFAEIEDLIERFDLKGSIESVSALSRIAKERHMRLPKFLAISKYVAALQLEKDLSVSKVSDEQLDIRGHFREWRSRPRSRI